MQPYQPEHVETPYYIPSEPPRQSSGSIYEQGYRGPQKPSLSTQQQQAQWHAQEEERANAYEQPQAQYPEMLPPM